jgi:hypothetical protein
MNGMFWRRFFAVAVIVLSASLAPAQLVGTTPLIPGGSVAPGIVPPGTDPGTLLASLSAPFTTIDTSGTLVSAVFREATGTLDFYYQVNSSLTSTGEISRTTDSLFTGFLTSVGFRLDGAAVAGSLFVNGIVGSTSADRNLAGSVVGFTFGPPDAFKVFPGTSSTVLVISTNATSFTSGFASLIDGGATTVASFAPAAVPEPSTFALLGVSGLVFLRLRRRAS